MLRANIDNTMIALKKKLITLKVIHWFSYRFLIAGCITMHALNTFIFTAFNPYNNNSKGLNVVIK